MKQTYLDLLAKHPFLAVVKYVSEEYVCVIQNQDNDVTTIYDYGALKSDAHRQLFLELADTWYWESNRMIPINIFLRNDWDQFKYSARSLVTKEVEIVAGDPVKLENLSDKRTKRRTITLVKR